MEIITVKMAIPKNIYKDVKTGSSILQGLVKDANSKQIKKHIELIPISSKELAMQALKANKNILIGLGIATTTLISSYFIYKKVKKHNDVLISQEAAQFSENLTQYLEQIEQGTLNYQMLTNLTDSLNKLTDNDKENIQKIILSHKQLQTLTKALYNYTNELAKANSIKPPKLNKPAQRSNNIIDLNDYWVAQKAIIKPA